MRLARPLSILAIGGIVAVFIAPALLAAVGLHALVVRGGSMTPVLRTGDAVIVRGVPARSLAVGDIVTLPDLEHGDATVTHRLIARNLDGAAIDFVTKGDANQASERWSLNIDDRVGRLVARLPALGGLAVFVSLPLARAAALFVIAIMFVTTGGSERPIKQRLT